MTFYFSTEWLCKVPYSSELLISDWEYFAQIKHIFLDWKVWFLSFNLIISWTYTSWHSVSTLFRLYVLTSHVSLVHIFFVEVFLILEIVLLARAVSVPVGRCSHSRLATTLMAAISIIVFPLFSPVSPYSAFLMQNTLKTTLKHLRNVKVPLKNPLKVLGGTFKKLLT